MSKKLACPAPGALEAIGMMRANLFHVLPALARE